MGRLFLYFADLVLFLILARVLNRALQVLLGKPRIFFRSSRTPRAPAGSGHTIRGEMARDPVCGIFVSTELSHPLKEGGRTIHFCSRECLARYQKEARKAQE